MEIKLECFEIPITTYQFRSTNFLINVYMFGFFIYSKEGVRHKLAEVNHITFKLFFGYKYPGFNTFFENYKANSEQYDLILDKIVKMTPYL